MRKLMDQVWGMPLVLGALVVVGIVAVGAGASGYETNVYKDLGGDRLVVAASGEVQVEDGGLIETQSGGEIEIESGGTLAVESGGSVTIAGGATLTSAAVLRNTAAAGTVVSTNGLALLEYGDGVVHQTVFTLTAMDYLIVDAAAAGAHAQVQLYDFPAGHIKIVGSTCDLTFTAANTNGLTTDATYDFGLGSAAAGTDNPALATTEQNVITKIEGDLSTSAASLESVNSTDLTLDGTSTAADLWLNAAFAADDASANQAATMAGTVTVTWVNLGDY